MFNTSPNSTLSSRAPTNSTRTEYIGRLIGTVLSDWVFQPTGWSIAYLPRFQISTDTLIVDGCALPIQSVVSNNELKAYLVIKERRGCDGNNQKPLTECSSQVIPKEGVSVDEARDCISRYLSHLVAKTVFYPMLNQLK